jgi:hypothetical protein
MLSIVSRVGKELLKTSTCKKYRGSKGVVEGQISAYQNEPLAENRKKGHANAPHDVVPSM